MAYALSIAKLDATGHRWLSALVAYNIDIVCRPGTHIPETDIIINGQQMITKSVNAVCKAALASNG